MQWEAGNTREDTIIIITINKDKEEINIITIITLNFSNNHNNTNISNQIHNSFNIKITLKW